MRPAPALALLFPLASGTLSVAGMFHRSCGWRACAILVLAVLAGCAGEEDPVCAELRRGVALCDPSGGGFTCVGLPSSHRACAALVPPRHSEDACNAFMGCLYDGP